MLREHALVQSAVLQLVAPWELLGLLQYADHGIGLVHQHKSSNWAANALQADLCTVAAATSTCLRQSISLRSNGSLGCCVCWVHPKAAAALTSQPINQSISQSTNH